VATEPDGGELMGSLLAGNIHVPLFDGASKDCVSPMFSLHPNWIAEISAFGFDVGAVVDGPPGVGKITQEVCLHKILLKNQKPPEADGGCGGVITDFKFHQDQVLASGPVAINGCYICLSACNTLVYLDLPGVYQLVLNDVGGLGYVQVYLRGFTKVDLGRIAGPKIGDLL
jgi:hypothetical protein